MCQSLFFNKVVGLRPQVFSSEFCEISKDIFFTEHVWTTAPKRSHKKMFCILSLYILKCIIVRVKYSLTPKKLLQKVCQLILVYIKLGLVYIITY